MPSKRRGQALLLAVLLMVFAALLGSTFITVVALNLNQTARQEDQSSARQAATAGLQLIEQNLTNSPEGEKWRPEMLTPPPAPGDPDYNFYYTAVDRAQGWARNFGHVANWPNVTPQQEWDWIEQQRRTNSNNIAYVKFPDPRTATQTANTPTFLAEVRPLTATTAPDPSKIGNLQVSIIGLSENNEAVVERRVAYKGGYAQNPLVAAARSVTNWDFVNNVVPAASIASLSTVTSLTVDRFKGIFPPTPFYVLIGNPGGAQQSALVTVVAGTGNTRTFTLASPLPAVPPTNTRVEVAAAVGSPSRVDFDNSGTLEATQEAISFRTSQTAAPGSVWVNGSLLWFGNLFANNLRSSSTANSTNLGFIRASGLIDSRSDAINVANPQIEGAFSRDTSGNPAPIPPRTLRPSNANNGNDFPFVDANIPAEEKMSLVSDGWNRLLNNTATSTRQTKPFTPPSINSVSGGLDRYRQLTKFSDPANPTDPTTVSLYGDGKGIYVNNPEDKERIHTTTPPVGLREMTQAQLQAMWFDPGPRDGTTGNATLRLSAPAGFGGTGTPAPESLEQKHLRGWVGPDEFRARGVLIELDPAYTDPMTGAADPQIYITRDELVDSSTTPEFPSLAKSWRNGSSGSPTGRYRRAFDWPQNGVIFTEGNARVRGGAFLNANGDPNLAVNPGRSLTIVSMNNIYIEGSLNAGSRKVLLLAKKNVILNPTAVAGRVTAQTRAVSTSGNTITVEDGAIFRKGEWIENAGGALRQINTISADTLTLDSAIAATAGSLIRATADPLTGSGAARRPYYRYATRVGFFSDRLQRRLYLPGVTTPIRAAFRHSAQRKDALQVQVEAATVPPTTSADLSNKLLASFVAGGYTQSTVIPRDDKPLRIDYSATSPGTEVYAKNGSGSTPANDAEAAAISLEAMRVQMPTVAGAGVAPLKFTAATQVLNGYNAGGQPRFYFLTGIGNRYNHGQPPALLSALPLPRKQPILATPYTIPMGTSVQLWMNGAPSALTSDNHNGTIFESVGQFGFNPLWGGTPPGTERMEDVLTIDQSFYSRGHNLTTSVINDNPNGATPVQYTYDSRRIALNLTTPPADGVNSLSFQLNNSVISAGPPAQTVSNFFGNSVTGNSVPYYRLSRFKLEGPSNPFDAATMAFNRVEPSSTFNVNAFVYAQEGSWVVIPGGYFDEEAGDVADPRGQIRSFRNGAGTAIGTYLDLNWSKSPDPGEFLDADNSGTFTAGDGADLNRDGTITREEQTAAYRFHRYNQRIVFTGAICERQSVPVLDEVNGTTRTKGGVQEWTDKWATSTITAANFVDANANGSTDEKVDRFDPNSVTAPTNYNTITYSFDPAPLDFANFNDAGFIVPVMPGYEYSG